MATTYSLSATGERNTAVDEMVATELVEKWTIEVEEAPEGAILDKVDLSARTYTVEGAKVIAEFLTPLAENVVVAQLNDVIASRPEAEGLEILTSLCSIFANSTLTRVVLSDNALGNKGIDACRSVIADQPHLQELELLNNGLSKESMQLLSEIFKGSVHLRKLHFCNNMVGPKGAKFAGEILSTCPNLVSIRYAQCRQGREGTLSILQGLEGKYSLVELDLDGSIINQGGEEEEEEADTLTPLCNVLGVQPSLTHLNLKDCNLGTNGMTRVSEALLESNAKLIFLDVGCNELGPTPCSALADLLLANLQTLRTFKCEENELTYVGIERIMAVYTDEENVLEELFLTTNELGHRAAVALTAAVLPSLRQIHLDGNEFEFRDVQRLMDTFGDKLQEMEDNDSIDEEEEESGEEEEEEKEEKEGGEEEEKEKEDDELEPLTQLFSQNVIY